MNTPSNSRYGRTKSPGNLTTAQSTRSPRPVGVKLTPFKFGNSNSGNSPLVKPTRKPKDENTKPIQSISVTPTNGTKAGPRVTDKPKTGARTPMSSSSKFNATPSRGNSPSTPKLKRPATAPTTKEKPYLVEISDDIVVTSPRKLNFENSTPTSVCITSTVTFETPMARAKSPFGSPLSRTLSSSSLASKSQNNSTTSSHKLKRSRSEMRLSSDCGQNFGDCKNGESSRVSVGVRVRPLHSREHGNAVFVCGQEVQVASDLGAVHRFNFDHCFPSIGSHSSQEDVYEKMVKPLVDNAFDGYNACLFAYGQTGSGKTYSMMGTLKEETGITCETGIIPRFCQELISRAQEFTKQETPAVSSNIQISYLEVYNEKINDLLMPNSNNLKVREHPINGPYVADLSKKTVTSYKEIQHWIDMGNKRRATAATEMNDKSSRSHSLFTVVLNQTFAQVGQDGHWSHDQTRISQINLVDLAGSERISHSSVSSDRLREGVSINRSLLTLGKVITALIEKRLFVPYRESVLTWLLKDSLGGNSRTTMLATISPSSAHIDESLATLRYASQARSIVNTVHVNEAPQDKLIRELKAELERLKEVDKLKGIELQQKTDLWPDTNFEKVDKGHEILNELKLVNSENAKLKQHELKLQTDLKSAEAEIIKLKEGESKLKLSNSKKLEFKESELKSKLDSAICENNQLKCKESSLKADLDLANFKNEELTLSKEILQNDLTLANSTLHEVNKELSSVQNQLDLAICENNQFKATEISLKNDLELARSEITNITHQLDMNKNELQLVNLKNSNLKDIEVDLKIQLDSLKTEIENKNQLLNTASSKESQFENELKLVNLENSKLKELENELHSQVVSLEAEIDNIKKQNHCQITNKEIFLNNELNTANAVIAKYVEMEKGYISDRKTADSEISKLNNNKAELESKLDLVSSTADKFEKEKHELESKLEIANAKITELTDLLVKSELESAESKISGVKGIETIEIELKEANSEITLLKSELDLAKADIIKFKEIESLLQSQLKMADTENSNLRKKEHDQKTKLQLANAESTGINEINRQLISELEAAKTEITELKELKVKQKELLAQLKELTNVKTKLESQVESLKSENNHIKCVEGQLLAKLKLANSEISNLKEQKLLSKLESTNKEVVKIRENELEAKIDSANCEIKQLKTKLQLANSEIEQLKALQKKIEEKYSAKEQEFAVLKKEKSVSSSNHKEILAENVTLKRDLNINSKRLLKKIEKNKCLTTSVDKLEIILKMVLENKLTAAKEKELLERALVKKDIDAFDYVMNLSFPHHLETLVRKARSLSELYIIPYDFELQLNQVEVKHLILRAKAILHHAQFNTWVETLEREKVWKKISDKDFPWEVDFGDYYEEGVGDEEKKISTHEKSFGCFDPKIWRESLIRRHVQGIKDDSEVLFKYFPNSEDSRIFSILCRIKASVARLEEATKDMVK